MSISRKLRWLVLCILLIALIVPLSQVMSATAPHTLGLPTPTQTYTLGDTAGVIVAPDLTITEPTSANLTGARVTLGTGYAAGQETLSISGTLPAGITAAFDTASGSLRLVGTASISDYQQALRQVMYQANLDASVGQQRAVHFTLSSLAYNPVNGHFYEYISTASVSWTTALTDAATQTFEGRQGYLATITSARENTTIDSIVSAAGTFQAHFAATDDPAQGNPSGGGAEGRWFWAAGPEKDTLICIDPGAAACVPEAGAYMNWSFNEPNNNLTGEQYGVMDNFGRWNDYQANAPGYVVEYGGMAGDSPANSFIGTVTLNFNVPTLDIPTSSINAIPGAATGQVIAPDLNINHPDTVLMNGARVSISNYVSGQDVLEISGTPAGIFAFFDTTSGSMTLTGSATVATYEAALRLVTYRNSNGVLPTGTPRTIVFNLTTDGYNPGNGHFYRHIPSSLSWTNAFTSASTYSFYGATGYMATITAQSEQSAVNSLLGFNTAWIGASDAPGQTGDVEGQWYWVTGPEAGTLFCVDPGATPCIPQAGAYTNWRGGEPNNNGNIEHYGETSTLGWNDSSVGTGRTLLVEFGGSAGDPTFPVIFDQVTVNIASAAQPTLTIPTTAVTYTIGSGGVAPAPDALATSSVDLTGASVYISTNFNSTQDILRINGLSSSSITISGYTILYSYSNATGIMTLSGTAPASVYQSVLRLVQYANLNTASPDTSPRTLVYTLGGLRVNPDNGHYYGSISGNRTWASARTHASTLEYYGWQGYLATITSSKENNVVSGLAGFGSWLGGTDDPAETSSSEGNWFWVTGPEAGTLFCIDGGATCPAEPGLFTAWSNPQPDNFNGAEHYMAMSGGTWNDLTATNTSSSYVIEFGGMPGDGALSFVDSVTVNFQTLALNIPTTNVTYDLGNPTGTLVAPDAVVTASGNISSAYVYFGTDYTQGNDILEVTAPLPGGITASFSPNSGVLRLSGSASAANYQAAIRLVRYRNTTGTFFDLGLTRTVYYDIGQLPVDPISGHYLQYVSTTANWATARTNASSSTYFGMAGYLVTIEAARENAAVRNLVISNTYIGASDDPALTGSTEGNWYWVTGPNAGTLFCVDPGAAACVAQSGRYQNWGGGEPNNNLTGEHVGEIRPDGLWNDEAGTSVRPYMIEYGGSSFDPALPPVRDSVTVTLATPTLTIPDPDTAYSIGTNTGIPVAPNANIIYNDAYALSGARVAIANYSQGQDFLELSSPITGISATFDTATGTLILSGNATVAEYESALRGITYRSDPTAALPNTQPREIVYSLSPVVFNPQNRHYYTYTLRTGSLYTWNDANPAASATRYFGWQGYLATITSAQEHNLIYNMVPANNTFWAGGSDAPALTSDVEGRWYWVTGPEAGSVFCTDMPPSYNAACLNELDGYSNWNLGSGEPNNSSSNEHYLEINTFGANAGRWNDRDGTVSNGYIVEFGGMAGDTTFPTIIDSVIVNFSTMTLTIPTSAVTHIVATPVVAAPDATITATGDLTRASVYIGANFVTGEDELRINGLLNSTVSLSGYTLTYAYNATLGVMTLTGTAPASVYQDALRLVTFNTSAAPSSLSPRTVGYTLSTLPVNPVNGHYYQYITGMINWTNAQLNARQRIYFGATGYLATITSSRENQVIRSLLTDRAMIGASDEPVITADAEGRWYWVTGPEVGTLFCVDAAPSGPPCTPEGTAYTNWTGGEPNNNNPNSEDFGEMILAGTWNDLTLAQNMAGYVVEYGGLAGDLAFTFVDSVQVNLALPPTINVLEPMGNNDGATDTFTITWTDADPDSNASISLYYDTDNTGANGTLITSGLSENDPANAYAWDVSAIPPGNYYIYAVIDDGVSPPVTDYSAGYVVIDDRPVVTVTTPADNAMDVPINTSITVTFSEAVNFTAGSFTLSCNSVNQGFTLNTPSPAQVVQFTPTAALPNSQVCSVTVNGTQVTDDDDFADTMSASTTFSFTTVDLAPTVASVTPANGTANVAVNLASISINFSEPVNVTASAFTLQCGVQSIGLTNITAIPASTITLTLDSALPNTATCNAAVIANQVTDEDAIDPPDMMAANYTWAFSTADLAPSVISTTPAANAGTVPVDTNITITFSEAVNFTAADFSIACTPATTATLLTSTASPASSVTLTLSAPLPSDATCIVTAASTITDADSGNFDPPDALTPYSFDFTTDDAPQVASTNPINNATNVSVSTPIQITFTEEVLLNATSPFRIDCTGSSDHPFSLSGANPGTAFTLTPATPLPISALCTVTITAARVTDTDAGDPPDTLDGNADGVSGDDYTFSFSTTEDAPTVVSISPLDGAAGIGGNTDIVITFSEAVTAPVTALTLTCSVTPSPISLSITPVSGTTFTLDPAPVLASGENCTLAIDPAQIVDVDPVDPPNTMAAPFSAQFTIDNAPTVSSHSPINGAVGVPPATSISVTFSENVVVTIATFDLDCTTSPDHTFALTGTGANYTLNPDPMPLGDICTVTVLAGGVTDSDAGDPPDNMAADYSFSFTIDDAAPTVVATLPANNASNIGLTAPVMIAFSESVNYSASAIIMSCATSGAVTFTATPPSPATSVMLTPTTPLSEGERCTVTVVAAEVTDADLVDPQDAMTADVSFSFTLDTAPSVATTLPADGASGVPINSDISITFSEDVAVTGAWFEINCPLSGVRSPLTNVAVSGGAGTWVLNPADDFSNLETCTITVFAAQVADTDAGNPPQNMAADYVFTVSFEEQPPAVINTFPAASALDVPVDMVFEITFNELVTASPTAFQLDCGGTLIPLTVQTASPNTVFSLQLDTPMPTSTACTLTVLAVEISDEDTSDPMDNMLQDYLLTFTTASTPDTAPFVIRTEPARNTAQVARNANILITFSEPVLVTLDSFDLTCSYSGTVGFGLIGAADSYLIDPRVDLAEDEVCTLTIYADQVVDEDTDDAPDTMTRDYVISFIIGATLLENPTEPAVPQFKDSDFITKLADKFQVQRGEIVTFTLTYRNPKGNILNQVVISDVFDARFTNLQMISNTLGNAVLVGNTLTVQGISLLPGQSGSIVIQATIARDALPGFVRNTATLESPDASIHVSNEVVIVILPDTLPATGESAGWLRYGLLLAALAMVIGWLLYRHRVHI